MYSEAKDRLMHDTLGRWKSLKSVLPVTFFLGKLERRNSNTQIKFEVPAARHG